jgi:hypothetical protein
MSSILCFFAHNDDTEPDTVFSLAVPMFGNRSAGLVLEESPCIRKNKYQR